MKKSYSLKYLSAKPKSLLKLDRIQFNPDSHMVGKSRIDTLPVMSRRASMDNFKKYQQNRLILDNNPKNNITQMKRTIQRLTNENNQLKRKLDDQTYKNIQLLKMQYKQKQQKLYTEAGNTTSLNNSKQYKNNILSKLNSNNTSHTKSKCPSTTQCQTRLFASKFSLSQNQNTICQIYQSHRKGNRINTDRLLKIVNGYFEEFKSNFLKLKIIVQNFNESNKMCKQQIKDISQLTNILTLFKVPILFEKMPQKLEKSLSKSRDKLKVNISRNKQSTNIVMNNNFCAQMKSADQTLKILQALLLKVSKSQRMLSKIQANQTINKIFKKIYQN